jgi:hypothetical protein
MSTQRVSTATKWATFGLVGSGDADVSVGKVCEGGDARDLFKVFAYITARHLGRGTAEQCHDLTMLVEAWGNVLAPYGLDLVVVGGTVAQIVEL